MGLGKKTPRKPQSSELPAGAGFTFEDAVGAYFLAALLGEGYAPGIEDRLGFAAVGPQFLGKQTR